MAQTKKDKSSSNPNFVPCGQGEEQALKQSTLRIRSGAVTEIRFIACAAPIEVHARLDSTRCSRKGSPTPPAATKRLTFSLGT